VKYDSHPEANEHYKWNNHNDEGQERPGICVWLNLFESAPKDPDRCDRQKQWHEAEED